MNLTLLDLPFLARAHSSTLVEVLGDDFQDYEDGDVDIDSVLDMGEGWDGPWKFYFFSGHDNMESYSDGNVSDNVLEGGVGWDGKWRTQDYSSSAYQGYDNMQSYTDENPVFTALSGGVAWAADWVIKHYTLGFFKMDITANGGANVLGVAEIQLRTSPGGTNYALNRPATASSTQGGGLAPSAAVDGVTASYGWVTPTSIVTGWLLLELEVDPTTITEVKLTAGGTGSPKDFTFQTSLDGVNYTTVKTVTNQTGWNASPLETRTYTIP